jgi:hypothetical protein
VNRSVERLDSSFLKSGQKEAARNQKEQELNGTRQLLVNVDAAALKPTGVHQQLLLKPTTIRLHNFFH